MDQAIAHYLLGSSSSWTEQTIDSCTRTMLLALVKTNGEHRRQILLSITLPVSDVLNLLSPGALDLSIRFVTNSCHRGCGGTASACRQMTTST